jgi:TolA-binding protein
MEDSLQRLASMSEAERLVIIDTLIARIEKEEQRQRELEMLAMQDQQFNRMALNESKRSGFNNSAGQDGKWYFYNQAAKGFGQPEFKMKWGNRKLEDNWRRSNKSTMSFETEEEEGEVSDTSAAVEEATKILSNKSREFYLKDVPLTDSMMELSNARLVEGLYNSANIYRAELSDEPKALDSYKRLITLNPEDYYMINSYFYVYQIYNRQDDLMRAETYKTLLVRDYPESQQAQLLTNPNYIDEQLALQNEMNIFYQETYDMYYRGDYYGVMVNADTAFARWPDDDVIPKFEFLRVLAIGKTQDALVFAQALDTLSKTTQDPEIARRSKDILAFILDTDREVKTEAQKIEAEVIYSVDTTGQFVFGLFVHESVDINQLKFEFINLNLDLYPNRTFDIADENLSEDKFAVFVRRFENMEKAWEYYDQVMNTEPVFDVVEGFDYQLFIISAGNEQTLLEDRIPNKYWLFFQNHYTRNEGN